MRALRISAYSDDLFNVLGLVAIPKRKAESAFRTTDLLVQLLGTANRRIQSIC